MGYEDEAPSIEQINDTIAQQKKEAELRQAETIIKSEQNMKEHQEEQIKLKKLAEVLGVTNMQHEIDDIKTVVTKQDQSITYLAQRSDEMIKAINNLVVAVQGAQPQEGLPAPQATPQLGPQTHLHTLLQLLESPIGEKVLGRLFPESAPAAPTGFLSQDYINEQVSNAVRRKFELGDIVVDAVESSLTKGLTKQIVKSTLQNAASTITHEPE